ncbi:penicillin acylase family protein [Winogradskyella sp. DF17]|uniref:Penicillin acylase family protein n=1 Tax=Winogradskyella pelagia TaxID=2819984 RepID=A0ABS3T1P1_9FLAO|nr:penicillin acylase family protein [Winogradskyella sp. DF17]MBO3116663.1 penicillin acylase family protein [Winogradskyella sp. DF17]
MKYLKLILSLVLTIVVFYVLNTKLGSVPPIAKFLNPYTGIWQNETPENVSGEMTISGFVEPVTIHYDDLLIPHIFAQNNTDLYRAQGYVTAKHRLWQLEFQTYAAAGRLSEIVGEGAINYDRQQRRLGMVYGAEQALAKMKGDSETMSYLQAYSDGINAHINSLEDENLPVEYKLLDYRPEPWNIKKTALLLMYMTKTLASREHDLEYTNALRIFGEDTFNKLYPDFFDIVDPVIPKDTDWSFVTAEQTARPLSEIPLDTIPETLPKPNPNNGSNNWAISGDKSATGNPMLANDPHLTLNLPSIWYVMQLSTPEHSSMGATLPGALGIISGFNTHIAWGVTNATRDLLDWYKIEFKDNKRTQYKYGDGWKNTTMRIEDIQIKNGKTIKDTVLYTHHGPVVYDHNFKGDNALSGYAMKWIGLEGGNNQSTFLDLNQAKNYNDYLNAIKPYVAPAQNFVFASTEGDIALWVQGKFPNKWEGQGKFLMDGSNPDHDWPEFIPQEFNAHTKNPKRGFVSSANQHPVDEQYPFYVFNDGYDTYRSRIINNFFRSKDKFSVEDLKGLQNSTFNLKASEMLPYILETMDTSSLTEDELKIYNEIKDWNFYSNIEKRAPSIWSTWWPKLYMKVWDEYEIEDVALDRPFAYQTIYMLTHMPNDEFMDIKETPETESAQDLFLMTFKETAKELIQWKVENGAYTYQKYKGTFVGHLLQGLPAFSRFELPIGGDGNTVNAMSKNHGPSWRMVIELSSPPQAYGIYPGGQSGNPGSIYYDNLIDDWAVGKYHKLNFLQTNEANEGIIGTKTIKPSNQ